jgi:hypothetical protein
MVGEMPEGSPNLTREKDRACYRHQLVQIDLTFVRQLDSRQPVSVLLQVEGD